MPKPVTEFYLIAFESVCIYIDIFEFIWFFFFRKNAKRQKTLKEQQKKIIENVREKIQENSSCSKCSMLQSKTDILLKENVSRDKEIEELHKSNNVMKAKYAKLKEKYRNLKRSTNERLQETAAASALPVEHTQLGPTLLVDSYKLSCCRNSDFSKFTGDLLDVVFGPDVLGTSVLKGIAGCQKISILNPETIQEIQMFVSKKFSVSISQVRNSIRQKLNVCHKAYKKVHSVESDYIR